MTKFCELRETPEGERILECIDPDARVITREVLAPTADVRAVTDRAAIEAEGFVLAWERPL